MNNELPAGWASATVGDLGDYVNGRGFKTDEWREAGRPIIRIQNLTGSRTGYNYFQGEADERHVVRAGDLLVSWAATLGVFVWSGEEAVLNQHIFKVDSWIHKQFHRWLLEFVLNDLHQRTHGSGMVHITRGNFEATPVPVPPLAEQERIVAAIEEHFSRLDFAEAALKATRSKLQALRRSVLAAAFSGRLTNPSHTTNTDHGQLPGGWRLASIADVAEVHLGRQRSPRHHTGEQMRPYLRAANVTWDGISLEDVKTMNFDDADFDRFRLTRGDILLNEASGSPNEVGKPAVWDGEIEECCFQNTLLRLRPRDLNGDYLYWYCYSSALSGRFGEAGRGVNIRHLGKRGLAQFPIPLGPRAEQEHVVAAIEESLSRLDAAEAALDAVRTKIAAFRRSVLAEAFAGRLVPQDPDDEPAAALLTRIAAEHPARPTTRKKSS